MNTTTTRAQHRGIDALLAERITRTLNEQHRTVAELARQTGISSPCLHRRLSGQTVWTLSELGEIANALGCGWGELVPEAVES